MAYSETLLWDYRTENEGTIVYGKYTVTLRDDAEKYNKLVVEEMSNSADVSNVNWHQTTFYEVPVNVYLVSDEKSGYINTSYKNRTAYYTFSGKSFQATANGANNNGLIRVYGVKY